MFLTPYPIHFKVKAHGRERLVFEDATVTLYWQPIKTLRRPLQFEITRARRLIDQTAVPHDTELWTFKDVASVGDLVVVELTFQGRAFNARLEQAAAAGQPRKLVDAMQKAALKSLEQPGPNFDAAVLSRAIGVAIASPEERLYSTLLQTDRVGLRVQVTDGDPVDEVENVILKLDYKLGPDC